MQIVQRVFPKASPLRAMHVLARGLMCCLALISAPMASVMAHESTAGNSAHAEPATLPPPPPIVVRVTGYAAYQASEEASADPQRLRAIRASKLDAYRNLAERVYGIALQGHSSVSQFELKDDGFSAALDTVIRGARVVSISENKKTGIETVLELLLPGHFQDCLNKANHFRYEPECLRPLPPITSSGFDAESGHRRHPSPGMETVYYLN